MRVLAQAGTSMCQIFRRNRLRHGIVWPLPVASQLRLLSRSREPGFAPRHATHLLAGARGAERLGNRSAPLLAHCRTGVVQFTHCEALYCTPGSLRMMLVLAVPPPTRNFCT